MDIVEQLRKSANTIYEQDGYTFRLGLQNEAADEIERLRAGLQDIANFSLHGDYSNAYVMPEIALRALGLPLRGMKESE